MRIDGPAWVKKRVLLITGEEAALRDRVMDAILESSAADEFDREEVMADQQEPKMWIGAAGTAPFLSDRRVVTVRHVLRSAECEGLEADLKGLPDTALLILVADEEPKGDSDRQGRLTTIQKNWEQLVKKAGGEVIPCAIKEIKAALELIRADSKAMGKELTPVAAEALMEICGGNYTRANSELQKVALFVGAAAEIREKDVMEVAVPSREWNIFKLVDAVVSNQPGGALRQLRILVASPTKAEDAANRSVIPIMLRQIKLLWQARMLLDSRMSVERAHDLLPSKPNLAQEKDWVQRKATDSARKLSTESIEALLRELADADARLKGILPGSSAMETLEQFILRCCEIVRTSQLARVR